MTQTQQKQQIWRVNPSQKLELAKAYANHAFASNQSVCTINFVADAQRQLIEELSIEEAIRNIDEVLEYTNRVVAFDAELKQSTIVAVRKMIIDKYSHLAVKEVKEGLLMWFCDTMCIELETTTEKKITYDNVLAVLNEYCNRRNPILKALQGKWKEAWTIWQKNQEQFHTYTVQLADFDKIIAAAKTCCDNWKDVPIFYFRMANDLGKLELSESDREGIRLKANRLAKLELNYETLDESAKQKLINRICKQLAVFQKLINNA